MRQSKWLLCQITFHILIRTTGWGTVVTLAKSALIKDLAVLGSECNQVKGGFCMKVGSPSILYLVRRPTVTRRGEIRQITIKRVVTVSHHVLDKRKLHGLEIALMIIFTVAETSSFCGHDQRFCSSQQVAFQSDLVCNSFKGGPLRFCYRFFFWPRPSSCTENFVVA